MSAGALYVHSLAEAYLYLEATPCPVCGHGVLKASSPRIARTGLTATITSTCTNCGASDLYECTVRRSNLRPEAASLPDCINPTADPSRVLDVGQWLTLYRLKVEAAGQTADKAAARRLLILAGECLDEALRFYPPGQELPPDTAFVRDSSVRAWREDPDRFSRTRLLELRSPLPTPTPLEYLSPDRPKRPWWRFW